MLPGSNLEGLIPEGDQRHGRKPATGPRGAQSDAERRYTIPNLPCASEALGSLGGALANGTELSVSSTTHANEHARHSPCHHSSPSHLLSFSHESGPRR